MGIVSAVCDKQFLFPNDAFFFCEWKINFKYTKMHPHDGIVTNTHILIHKLYKSTQTTTTYQISYRNTNGYLDFDQQTIFFSQTCLFGISDAFSERGIHLMLLKLNIKKITRWKRWKKSELQNDRNFYWREKREKCFELT